MSTITLQLPRLHEGQQQVKNEASRFNIVNSGRRWGKTLFGTSQLIEPALAGFPVAWFSPHYKMLAEVWRSVRDTLKPITKRVSQQQHRLELVTGGVVEMWSLDQADTARGRKYKRVCLDEAAMVKGLRDAWQMVIRPTLTDYIGDAWFLSTPKGMNYYFDLYNMGQDPKKTEFKSWTFPTVNNPFIMRSEIEAARQELPERVFAQEYLAQFIGDGTGVFRKVNAAATATPLERPLPGHSYVMGCDWGKLNDFSVFIVMDAETKEMVYMERFNQIDYVIQIERLEQIYNLWRPLTCVIERNSVGEMPYEVMRRKGMRIMPFVTTQPSKALIITALELAFDRGHVKIFDDPVVLGELLAYDAERLPGGSIRYSAPEGQHDDIVMALALCWHGLVGRGVIEAMPEDMVEALTDYMLGGY